MNQETAELTLRVHAGAPPAQVMEALTTPEAMTVWLAEHAEVSLPAVYRFWGRYTPYGREPAQEVLAAGPETLRYRWTLAGAETEVDLTVSAAGDGTTVALRHTGGPEAAPVIAEIQTFWAATLANLVDYVEERAVLGLTDLTSPTLRAETTIRATPEEVFASLVDPDKVTAWFGFPTAIHPEIGGEYGYGTITALTPNRQLSVSYGPMGVATWELDGSDGETRLVFSQSGFEPGQPPYEAWLGAISGLAELRRFHEVVPWKPIWLDEAEPLPAGQEVPL